jgi:hypothetical protein
MKNWKRCFVLLALFTAITGNVVFAQTAPRTYYVRADGDDNNNGRSEDAPFKTLQKAVEMANAGIIKQITVIGTISGVNISGSGADEILITGKPDANEQQKAVINGIRIDSPKIRFTHITLERLVKWGSVVTFGSGVKGNGQVDLNYANLIMTDDATITGGTNGVYIHKEGGVTMLGNSSITDNKEWGISTGSEGVDPSSLVTMSGNSKVSNNGKGVACTKLIMSDNAEICDNIGNGAKVQSAAELSGNAKIRNNKGCGIDTSSVTISGNVVISGNQNGGIFTTRGTMTGNPQITGNRAKIGGGIEIANGTFTMEGGTITGNKAEYGAGVYIGSGSFTIKGGTVIGNEAEFVGGGVYVKKGATYNAQGGKVTGNTAGDGGEDVFRQ